MHASFILFIPLPIHMYMHGLYVTGAYIEVPLMCVPDTALIQLAISLKHALILAIGTYLISLWLPSFYEPVI